MSDQTHYNRGSDQHSNQDPMKRILGYSILAIAIFFGLQTFVISKPTPIQDTLTWEDPNNNPSDVAGYMFYYALESEPEPRIYDDNRRFDGGKPAVLSLSIKAHLPSAKGQVCFRATAYDSSNRESDFSNESCGWQGMGNPQNLEAK